MWFKRLLFEKNGGLNGSSKAKNNIVGVFAVESTETTTQTTENLHWLIHPFSK